MAFARANVAIRLRLGALHDALGYEKYSLKYTSEALLILTHDTKIINLCSSLVICLQIWELC